MTSLHTASVFFSSNYFSANHLFQHEFQLHMVLSSVNKPFSKRYDISCHKGYTGKNEKQVGCYVNLVGVETFSDI